MQLTGRAVRQAGLGDVGDTLKVVMALVTEVGGAKAEEDGHRTTVATLVLQEVRTMLWTHLHKRIYTYKQKDQYKVL